MSRLQRKATLAFCRAPHEAGYLLTFHDDSSKRTVKPHLSPDCAPTVRSKPEHRAAVEGKLMPNEVVCAIDKDGKWVEVEYDHWLREEYGTGWVLKKYLEWVPLHYQNGVP